MARIAFLYLPWPGHLNPLSGLGRELLSRGHQVAFFQLPEMEQQARALGLPFLPFGIDLEPSVGECFQAMGELEGGSAAEAGLRLIDALGEAVLTAAEPALRRWGPDLLVVDQMDYAGSTLARILNIPFVTAAVTLLKQDEEGVPGFDGRPHRAGSRGRPAALQTFLDRLERYRRAAGLGPFSYSTLWSELAQISQQPPQFEFPRRALPPTFHFTGPWSARAETSGRPPVDFPWQRLDGRPLVYASLGTAFHRRLPLLRAIVEGSQGLGVQLVLSAGVELPDLPEHVVAVPFAPQLEILRRARLMITHAGMNSALECLSAGVPMLALPLAHDQPGVACRVERTGTGLVLPVERRTPQAIAAGLDRLLREESFRLAAERMRDTIASSGGLLRAADVVEKVLRGGGPVVYDGVPPGG